MRYVLVSFYATRRVWDVSQIVTDVSYKTVLLNAFNAQTRPLNQGWAKDQRQTLGIRS